MRSRKRLLKTVALPSSGEIMSNFSSTMKWTRALSECKSESKADGD